jgi:hypothetical protein
VLQQAMLSVFAALGASLIGLLFVIAVGFAEDMAAVISASPAASSSM